MKPKIVNAYLIYNPTAGQIWSPFAPQVVVDYLAKHYWQVRVCPTEHAGHASDLAREAVKQGCDVVIVAGGDGTINEAIQGLAHSETRLAILPVGTTNVLARELQIPLNFQEALESLPVAKPRRIDLGQVNRRYFLLMAGVGYDAEVVKQTNPQLKSVLGKTAVVTSAVFNLFNHSPHKVKLFFIDQHNKRHRLKRIVMQIFISNAATYATDYKIAEQANMQDGLLELHIFRTKRFRDTLYSLTSLVLKQHKHWVDFEHYSIKSLRIESKQAIPVQIDGDTVGCTPITIQVSPQALTVLYPRMMPA